MNALEKISKLIGSSVNALFVAILIIIGFTTYWILSVIYGFLFPEQEKVEYVNTELINREMDDSLITSRAFIDAYLVLEKRDRCTENEDLPTGTNHVYCPNTMSLNDVRQNGVGFLDKVSNNREKYYQLCVYSVEVKFGYQSWQGVVAKAKNGELATAWPTVIGIEPRRQLAAPANANIESACRDAFSGSMSDIEQNAIIIRHWLNKDGVYRSHMGQGINQVSDIALWETEVQCELEDDCEEQKNNVAAWRDYQFNEAIDPIELDYASGRSAEEFGRGLPESLKYVPIRGVYKETYSSLIFLHAQGRLSFIPFTNDMEILVQRDVMEITYGSAIYFNDAVSRFGETTIYVSVPDVVMRSLIEGEYVLFASGTLDELNKAVNMPVAEYLQKKSNEILDEAIARNRDTAVRTSKAILRQKISMLKTATTRNGETIVKSVKVKFTETPPDTVGFADNGWMHYLENFR